MSIIMKMLVSIPVSTYRYHVVGGEKSSINRGVSETHTEREREREMERERERERDESKEGSKYDKLTVQATLSVEDRGERFCINMCRKKTWPPYTRRRGRQSSSPVY